MAAHLVKQKAAIKYPAPGVMVAAGVIKGRVRFLHVVHGRWNAVKACEMYTELAKVMAKAYPAHAGTPGAKWLVMEDNDPSGYKSSAAVAKKAEEGIKVVPLPPRSPDLNVLDFCLWSEISRRLRAQEARFHASKKETKDEFIARLRKTALRLPASVVTKAVKSMKKRCQQLRGAKGFLFDE